MGLSPLLDCEAPGGRAGLSLALLYPQRTVQEQSLGNKY